VEALKELVEYESYSKNEYLLREGQKGKKITD